MARVVVWAPTPRQPPATVPTGATQVVGAEGEQGMLAEGTRTVGVALQSTTPTGGIKYWIRGQYFDQ